MELEIRFTLVQKILKSMKVFKKVIENACCEKYAWISKFLHQTRHLFISYSVNFFKSPLIY